LTLGLAKELGAEDAGSTPSALGSSTPIFTPAEASRTARILGATAPMGHPGTAEEIAEAAVWLISDVASYVTGVLLDVAGGR
jgi:NAD(P)-dependent dehydrogenase (short-subunit alcohol dehydrogenase family)